MAFQIIRNDITKVAAEAIVNTANPRPVFGSGTDSAVYHAAGQEKLLAERSRIGQMQPGEVNVTDAYDLQARYIIHTVGPSWIDGSHGEYETLASCYRKSLHLADKLGCTSIAFPLIATGVYGFPKDAALQIALREIRTFLETADMDVTLVVFSRKSYELSAALTRSVRQFIDDNYCRTANEAEYGSTDPFRDEKAMLSETADMGGYGYTSAGAEADEEPEAERISAAFDPERRRRLLDFSLRNRRTREREPRAEKEADPMPSITPRKEKSLKDLIDQAGETFQEMLLRKMKEKGLSAPEVYKKANLDKKLFSKIRNNPDYVPKKQTAVALAIALKLNLDETADLIGRAGLAFSPSSKFDLIITYCIEHHNYDMFEINALLFDYDQPLLGV